MKRKIICIFVMTLLISSFVIGTSLATKTSANNSFNQLSGGYEKHANIDIKGNDEFTSENGVKNPNAEGTSDDPFIIEGWELNKIRIRFTTSYFIIQNCLINGKTDGIVFYNANNGHIKDCKIDSEKEDMGGYSNVPRGIYFSSGCNNFEIEHVLFLSYYICIDFGRGNITDIIVHDCAFQPKHKIWTLDFNDFAFHNCLFYNNDFLKTNVRPTVISNQDSDNQKFDNGNVGNYWIDYKDEYSDANKNGLIWDTPYLVEGHYEQTDIYDNNPLVSPRFAPDTPIISDVDSGKPDEETTLSVSAQDPQGEDVYYRINWGDGNLTDWDGPYHDNDKIEFSHIYTEENEYEINVKAKDTNGLIGPSLRHKISVGKSKEKTVEIPLLQFLDNYPMLYKLFKELFKI